MRYYKRQGMFWYKITLKSTKANVDDLFATEFHQLWEQTTHNICAALQALVSETE